MVEAGGGCWGVGSGGDIPNEASPLCLHHYHHNSFAFSSPMSEGLISGGSRSERDLVLPRSVLACQCRNDSWPL